MKKLTLIAFLSFMALFAVAIVTASADPITFTYSADNSVIGGWYITDGGSPVPIPSLPGATSWQTASTFTLNLAPVAGESYQIIWQVVNDDSPLKRDPSANNPGGFLAQITTSSPLFEGNWLSSSAWQVAFVPNLNQTADFNSLSSSLSWAAATEYGANSNSGTIWSQVNGGPIAGISGSSQWIWTASNFANAGAPGLTDSVFIKTTMTDQPVPEPSTLLLISSGLISLVGFRKKFRK